MKVLIIGGTRFFGKRLTQLMLDINYDVTILTRGLTADEFGNRVKRLHANRCEESELKKVIQKDYDVVIDNMLMNGTEAKSISHILEGKIGHYVMTSTMAVYDPQPGALKESHFLAQHHAPKETKSFSEEYQQGKRSAEYQLLNAHFSKTILRIPIIVGPDDYTQRLKIHVTATQSGIPLYFPNPKAKFSYLHAADAAAALLWAAQNKINETLNISAPNAWSLEELMQKISSITNKEFMWGEAHDQISSFGVPDDYFMNTSKAAELGFRVKRLESFMLELLKHYALSDES